MKVIGRYVGVLFGLLVGFSAQSSPMPPGCPDALDVSPETLKRLANSVQPNRGPLWEVTKDGRRAFLYGTVHVAKLEWDFPGPAVQAALNASNVLAVELDPTDPDLDKRQRAQFLALARVSDRQVKQADIVAWTARVGEQFQRACLDERKFGDTTLGSKITSLILLSARDEGLYPNLSIDAALVGYARATGKKIIELEISGEQTKALGGGGPESIERMLAKLESGEARTQLIRLSSAWANGDLSDIERYVSTQDQEEMGHLLGQRNATLAERLAHAYQTEDRVFAAIGMLHLVGRESVVAQLKRMGYSVQRR